MWEKGNIGEERKFSKRILKYEKYCFKCLLSKLDLYTTITVFV